MKEGGIVKKAVLFVLNLDLDFEKSLSSVNVPDERAAILSSAS